MSIIGSNILAGAAGSGVSAYEIEQSLRFDGSQKLSRTPSSAGTTTTWTLSYWIKIGSLTAEQAILSANPSAGGYTATWYSAGATSRLKINQYNHPTNVYSKCPTPVYRDPSAWFHVVVVFDSTNATADDRVRFYVNGVRQTDFSDDGSSVGGTTNPSQNQASGVNHNAIHYIGSQYDGTYAFAKSYLAEMHLLDGTAVTDAEDFGEYDSNGVWRPIEVSGVTYGTNGFYLKFDPTATNGIGHDHSGNGNNWTASGFTTSGTGTDVMSDTPTKNFPTLNPLDNLNGRYSNDPTNGNLEVSIPSDSVSKRNFPGFYSTQAIPTTGKFYFEFEPSQEYTTINIVDVDEVGTISSGDHVGQSDKLSFQYFCESGNYRFNGSSTASGLGGFTSGNIYGVRVDLENETFRVYENGIAGSELSISGYLGADARIAPSIDSSGASGTVKMNFGQREFANPPGTVGATDYFNTVLYTGNGSTQSITGVGFQPDLVFAKNRDSLNGWRVYDVARGVQQQIQLDSANAEETVSTGLTSFDSDGFTLGSSGGINGSGIDFAAYCWKAGGTGSANNSGSLDATVSANNDAGFSVVTYTGNSTSGATFAHGLDTAPSVVILKNRDSSSQGWMIYHSGMGATKAIQFTASGELTDTAYWNDTAPSSTLVTLGNDNATNATGDDYMAYCWAEKTGVSKFGSYTGNGSSDGPVISCGFRPAMVMIKWYKDVSTSESWQLYDNKRAGNPTNTILQPDSAGAEESPSDRYIQFTADGFQLKASGQQINRSGAKYIFMAWAATFTGDADFKSLNTANLPAPEIKDGSDYFDTVLWTGNATARDITTGHNSNFTWIKHRSSAENHNLYDILRGVGNRLESNSQDYEVNYTDRLTAFNSDGFSLGTGYNNTNTTTYVGWSWAGGGSGTSNSDGSINSTVSASPSSGFSIVTWTGSQANGTVGHSLGVPPSLIIFKRYNSNGTSWPVYHSGIGPSNLVQLNETASSGSSGTSFGSTPTAPTSTVFSVGNNGGTNYGDMVAYCFAEVENYSRIGSYTGNGSIDGPFVYCGFRPAMVIIKNASATANWIIRDSARSPYNKVHPSLYPNTSDAEINNFDMDFLSNGFKMKDDNTVFNTSGSTYVFMAWAENPFGGSGVSPATAR